MIVDGWRRAFGRKGGSVGYGFGYEGVFAWEGKDIVEWNWKLNKKASILSMYHEDINAIHVRSPFLVFYFDIKRLLWLLYFDV